MRARGLAAFLVAAAGVLAGCSNGPAPSSVPNNIGALEAAQPGHSLVGFGYTPVAQVFKGGKVVGDVYVVCNTSDVTSCATGRNDAADLAKRPNVYVVDGKVVLLEGPHDSRFDTRNYYMAVPASAANFAGLSHSQQVALLGVMPAISRDLGDPPSGGIASTVLLPGVGEVSVWVSNFPILN